MSVVPLCALPLLGGVVEAFVLAPVLLPVLPLPGAAVLPVLLPAALLPLTSPVPEAAPVFDGVLLVLASAIAPVVPGVMTTLVVEPALVAALDALVVPGEGLAETLWLLPSLLPPPPQATSSSDSVAEVNWLRREIRALASAFMTGLRLFLVGNGRASNRVMIVVTIVWMLMSLRGR